MAVTIHSTQNDLPFRRIYEPEVESHAEGACIANRPRISIVVLDWPLRYWICYVEMYLVKTVSDFYKAEIQAQRVLEYCKMAL